jgi:hypothetical protein
VVTDEISRPLFSGLVFTEQGQPAEVATVGGEPHYVILDGDFRRHVSSEYVDRQILSWLQGQITANRDMVTQGVLAMLGRDDLFSKAMVDDSFKNMDQLLRHGLPEDARMWLGMIGFRITVDVHGEVVAIDAPAQPSEE